MSRLAGVLAGCVLLGALGAGGWWAWTDLTKQQQALRDELATTQLEMQSLDNRLTGLERSMSAGGRDVAELVSDVQSQIDELDEATFGLSGHSFADPTINDLDGQIDDLEERIGTLEQYTQLEANPDPILESRLQELESDVDDICFTLSQAGVSLFC